MTNNQEHGELDPHEPLMHVHIGNGLAQAILASNTFKAGGNVNVNVSGIRRLFRGQGSDCDIEIIAPWLSEINYKLIQSSTISRVTEGTGRWIFKNRVFKDWVNGKTPTIWGTGTPGAGKTFLSSIIVQRLKSKVEKRGKIAVLSIYCRADSQLSISQILGSLLRQLAEDHPSELAYIDQKFYFPHIQNRTTPTNGDYVEMLRRVISHLSRVFIIVDGLDELEDNIGHPLLHSLRSLGASFLLVSRPLEDPAFYNLENTPTFEIKAEETELRDFILGEINRHTGLRDALFNRDDVKNEVVQAISDASQGIYLLASLHLGALKLDWDITVNAIREVITRLPRSLDEAYRLTFHRIDQQGAKKAAIARRALFWMLIPFRPLTVDELCLAASVSPRARITSPDDIISRETLLSACRGLIFYNERSGIVDLAHETIRDYLIDQYSSIFEGYHDDFIASCCVSALVSSGLHGQRDLDNQEVEACIRSWHLGYIGHYWLIYTKLCYVNGSVPKDVDDFVHGFSSYVVRIDDSEVWDVWQPIHLAMYLGLTKTIRGLREQWNAKSQQGITALHLAIKQQDEELVTLLLGFKSIDVNASSDCLGTPLTLACTELDEAAVRQLLSNENIDVNARNTSDNMTPLHSAIIQGRHKDPNPHRLPIIQLLLDHPDIEVDLPTGGPIIRTPLCLAVDEKSYDAAILLIDRGADPHAKAICEIPLDFGTMGNLCDALYYNKKHEWAQKLSQHLREKGHVCTNRWRRFKEILSWFILMITIVLGLVFVVLLLVGWVLQQIYLFIRACLRWAYHTIRRPFAKPLADQLV